MFLILKIKNFFKKIFLFGIVPSTLLINGCTFNPKLNCDSELSDNIEPLVLDIKASSENERAPINKAFDGTNLRKDSFWETVENYPHTVELNYSKEIDINSYSISSGEDSSRMPSDWVLEASCDGKKWVAIDRRENINYWKMNETIKFDTTLDKVKKEGSGGVKNYRFKFISGIFPSSNIMRIYEINVPNQENK